MGKARFTVYAALVLLFTFTANSQAGYSGGMGEPNSPFEIATVADWQQLMNSPADHALLTLLYSVIDNQQAIEYKGVNTPFASNQMACYTDT